MKTDFLHSSQINTPKSSTIVIKKELDKNNKELLVFEDLEVQFDHYIADLYDKAGEIGLPERDFYSVLQSARSQRNMELGNLDIMI